MARPLRIEFPGAVYHVTSRGDRQEAIFNDDVDRKIFLDVVSDALRRLQADAFAYCLMGNHYHFVLRTRLANLSRIMRHVNGEYARAYNRRYDVKGHLFQGRFGAILVDRQAYLMEVCRYVELNPVRAGIVETALEWPWSSYRAHVGLARSPQWLATNELRGHMLGREIRSADDERQAARLHADLVATAVGVELWPGHLRQEIFLGDEDFVSVTQAQAESLRLAAAEIPESHRMAPVDRATVQGSRRVRALAFRQAYYVDGMTMSAIARQANVSTATVSRLVAMAERLGPYEA